MENICFQKYIYDKCLASKLLGTRLYVLDFILNKEKCNTCHIIIDGMVYYHIPRREIALNTALDEQSVSTVLKFLCNNGFIKTFYDRRHKKLYIAPIIDICTEYMIPNNDEDKAVIEEDNVLFDYQEKDIAQVKEFVDYLKERFNQESIAVQKTQVESELW